MLSDTRVYEPQIRARLGTTAHFGKVVVLEWMGYTMHPSPTGFSPAIGIVLDLRTTTSHKCEAVPKRARI